MPAAISGVCYCVPEASDVVPEDSAPLGGGVAVTRTRAPSVSVDSLLPISTCSEISTGIQCSCVADFDFSKRLVISIHSASRTPV